MHLPNNHLVDWLYQWSHGGLRTSDVYVHLPDNHLVGLLAPMMEPWSHQIINGAIAGFLWLVKAIKQQTGAGNEGGLNCFMKPAKGCNHKSHEQPKPMNFLFLVTDPVPSMKKILPHISLSSSLDNQNKIVAGPVCQGTGPSNELLTLLPSWRILYFFKWK